MNKMFKKGLVLATAATMVISPMSVFAAEKGGTFGDNVEVGGDADLEYYDNTIISVTLPTSSIWDTPFAIDPQGALSITADDGKVVDGAKGTVVPKGIATIKNVSSVPVNVVAALWVQKNDDGEASSAELIASSGADGLAASAKNELSLQLLATEQITDADFGTLNSAAKDYNLLSNAKFATKKDITANGKADAMEISFQLKQATYILTMKDGKKGWYVDSTVSDNYSQVAFCVGGKVAQAADWSAYTGEGAEKIALKAVFTLEQLDTTLSDSVTIATTAAAAPTYFKESEGTTYDTTSETVNIAAKLTADYTVNSGADLVLPIDFGKGGKKVSVKTEDGLWADMGGKTEQLVEGTDFEITSSGITLKGDSKTLWVFKWACEKTSLGFNCVDNSGNTTWVSVEFATVE